MMTAISPEYPTTRRGQARIHRGFFEIGIYNSKTPDNLGTLWRSAYQLGAAGIFTIGQRYTRQPGDTVHVSRHVPRRSYADWPTFLAALPENTPVVAVEMGGRDLWTFRHPERAIYVLGAEDHGLPKECLEQCQHTISLEAIRTISYNVAVTGSIVMYHRLMQLQR